MYGTNLVALIGLSIYITGCAATSLFEDLTPRRVPTATTEDPVHEIVCLWEAAEGTRPDGTPARGFAGQVMFFTRGNEMPVKVGGAVTVYEFDDMGTPEEQARPLHVFRFDSTAWNVHLAEGPLGLSYNVFIPYMRKHACEANCSVRIRYDPVEGPAAYSSLASVFLPGIPRKQNPRPSLEVFDLQRWHPETSLDAAAATPLKSESLATDAPRQLRTLTIKPLGLATAGNGRLRAQNRAEQLLRRTRLAQDHIQQINHQTADSVDPWQIDFRTDDRSVSAFAY